MAQGAIDDIVKRGLEHHQAGRADEAVRLYREALSIQPTHPDALHLLGSLMMAAGRMGDAVELLSRAVAVGPGVVEFEWDLGRALAGSGRFPEAFAAYERALRLRPESAEIWNDLGNAVQLSGQWKESIRAYQKAISLNPNLADAWNNMGSALTELGELEAAITTLRRALEARPDYPEALNNLGNALQRLGRYEESLKEYDRALQQRPTYGRVYNNRGRALRMLDRRDEAMAAYARAIELTPNYPDAHNSLATSLLDELRTDESIASFRRAIELAPNFAEAHHNLGRVLLLTGDYENGWKEYEWRWGMRSVFGNYPQMKQPVWDSSDLNGKTILLHAEQGFGDTIQFIRYAPLVKERGGRVVVAVQPELGRLLAGVKGIDQVVIEGQVLPKFEVRSPLLSLPRIFGTTLETIPREVPYIEVEGAILGKWRERLAGDTEPLKVGLSWAGRPTFQDDRWRSTVFGTLWPALEREGVSYHSVQVGDAAKQIGDAKVKDWSNELTDFAETAGLLANLDLLITTDTAVAHLAGALGRRVWVLLPFSPDWRWMLGREDCPWYPTMKLFRSEAAGDWETPVKRIREALSAL